MASFNKVILIGNHTRDPELRYTPKGTAVAKFALAVNRVWTTDSGEKKEEVTFIDIDAFGRTAENIAQYMRKGSAMMVEGRLRLSQWDDRQTGQKRSKLSVLCETCQFLGGKRDDGGSGSQPQPPSDGRTAGEIARDRAKTAEGYQPAEPDEDDVPF